MNKITKETTANKQPEFYHPSVTADVLCAEFTPQDDKYYIYLIRRSPLAKAFPNCLAIPGGFMDFNDASIEDCAVRELAEETGIRLKKDWLNLNGVHTAKGRDPRGAVHSTSFYAFVGKDDVENAKAGDDAVDLVRCALIFNESQIEISDECGHLLTRIEFNRNEDSGRAEVANKPHGIAFDHAEIIAQFVCHLLGR